MQFINPTQLQQNLEWRYATKKFDSSKKIPAETVTALTESLRLSPSSFGLQPWKFLVITDEEIRKKLLPHSWNQPQITDCSHVVVHCYRKHIDQDYVHNFIEQTANARGTTAEELQEYEGLINATVSARTTDAITEWNKRQVYISHGFLLLAAAQLGVDACPMEGFNADEYDSILHLTSTEYSSAVVTALGYRHEDDKYATAPKVRFNANEVVEFI